MHAHMHEHAHTHTHVHAHARAHMQVYSNLIVVRTPYTFYLELFV